VGERYQHLAPGPCSLPPLACLAVLAAPVQSRHGMAEKQQCVQPPALAVPAHEHAPGSALWSVCLHMWDTPLILSGFRPVRGSMRHSSPAPPPQPGPTPPRLAPCAAGNVVPAMLRHHGVLRYSPDMAKVVDEGEDLDADPKEAVIRAAAVDAGAFCLPCLSACFPAPFPLPLS
jgi:hypothetical protein